MTEIKNLKKGALRILSAIKKNERIILYGDADLDGITAVIILEEAIKSLNGEVAYKIFPNREKEGYGITQEGLNLISKFSPALLICLDLGITNFLEIKIAKEIGFDVLVVDHHQILKKLPEASIIVDPFQEGDKYPFKELAACGLVFKLIESLFELAKKKFSDLFKQNLIELVALATLADLMPRVGENKIFIEEGISTLKNSLRPGLKTLFGLFEKETNSDNETISKIISILNLSETSNLLPDSYLILTTSDKKQIEKLINETLEKAKRRNEEIKDVVNEIEKRIINKNEPIIFESDSSWSLNLIGTVASRIYGRCKKPTFIIKIDGEESRGSVRTPGSVDSVKIMAKCSSLLSMFGGHPKASGFSIRTENIDNFKDCLIEKLKIWKI